MVAQVFLPLSLAFIMFSMGLTLTIDDFRRVTRFPKPFFIGFLLQVLSLPLLAFGLAYAWQSFSEIEAAFLAGLILIAACPGGVTSNMFTHLAKSDTALSISLTAVISVVSVLTIPFIVNFGLGQFMGQDSNVSMPIGKTIVGIFLITTVPVGMGMLVLKWKPTWTFKTEPLIRKIATVLFVIIVLGAVAAEWKHIQETAGTVGPVVVILNIITMAVAWVIARVSRLEAPQANAIVFECGLQNGTLAITIALTFLGNKAMMVPAGLYSLFMFASGGLYLAWCRKSAKENTHEPEARLF